MSMMSSQHYTPTAKWLHWVMAAIWIVSWGLGIIAVHWRDALNNDHTITILHKALASTVVFLIIVRVGWRLTHPAPSLPQNMSNFMRTGAKVGHLLLYVIALIGLPASGWYWSSVADKPVMVLGLFQLPPLVAPDQSLYDLAKWIHTLAAWGCGVLVSGHLLFALKHHIVDKDEVLLGMLPKKW